MSMKSRQKIIAMIVVLLLGATMYGLYRTGQPANAPVAPDRTKYGGAAPAPIVDQTPLLTAQRLAKMALSAEELPFAQEALRLGDQEMDLGFAAAVRESEEHPPVLSAEAKGIQARLQQAERALEADEAQVKQLTAQEEKASGEKRDALDDQLDVAKAQLELDQDEVDDAKQDLIRAGGDPQGRIQTMVEEHEAASHAADSLKVTVTALVEERGLIHRFQQWSVLHQKQLDLWSAKQDAESLAASFSAKHNAMEAQIAAARRESSEVARAGKHASGGREESTALLKATKRRSADEKALAGFDKRVNNEKQLAEVYGNWIDVMAAKQRSVVHGALTGLAIIFGILLIGLFFDNWLERLLGRTSLDRRQVETLRTVTSVAVQFFAVLFILLVIFGPPSQLGTFLGLAGPRNVPSWLGGPKITSKMKSTAKNCTATLVTVRSVSTWRRSSEVLPSKRSSQLSKNSPISKIPNMMASPVSAPCTTERCLAAITSIQLPYTSASCFSLLTRLSKPASAFSSAERRLVAFSSAVDSSRPPLACFPARATSLDSLRAAAICASIALCFAENDAASDSASCLALHKSNCF